MSKFIPKIHKYEATIGNFFVNAFLVETSNSVIAIDSTLAIPSTNDLIEIIRSKIKKKLSGILITHGHPDHYTGISELVREFGDIPVLSTQGAINQCMERDKEEGGYLGSDQAFGALYPKKRLFPNQVVKDKETYTFDNVSFTIDHLGACESDDDSMWSMQIENTNHVFSGDIIYNYMHTFFRDGHVKNWLVQIDKCINHFDCQTVFHTGHGEDMGIEMFYWKRAYIQAFLRILKELLGDKPVLSDKEKQILFTRMQTFLPNDKLMFLLGWQFDDMIMMLRKDQVI
jgi:glyoxylase-like metal-dependent hydrolase (beta-lactamase superfamily II)